MSHRRRRLLLPQRMRRVIRRLRRVVPWPLRILLGLALIVGGFFGFLPVLGFWMIPLGGALLLLELRPLRRARICRAKWYRHRRGVH